MSDLKFKPVGTKVLVEPIPAPHAVGAIMLPEAAREKRVGEATIVAMGERVPADFAGRVGDRVYTDRFAGQEVKLQGRSFRLHEPGEILAVVENV